jgi:hypothetical protein
MNKRMIPALSSFLRVAEIFDGTKIADDGGKVFFEKGMSVSLGGEKIASRFDFVKMSAQSVVGIPFAV